MSSATLIALAAGVLLLGANAFFVAAEFALVAARTTRLEADAGAGDRRSSVALASVRDIQREVAGCQLGITMTSLGLGFVAEPAVGRLVEPLVDTIVDVPSGVLHTISFTIALAVVGTLHVTVGEMVPKNLAIAAPERTARLLAPALHAHGVVFRPVIWWLNAASTGILRLFGMQPVDEINTALTVNEFRTLLAGAVRRGVIEPAEHDVLSGALGFSVRSAGSLIVPMERLVSVARSAPVDRIEQIVAATGHTRVPIWGSAPDDVLGFVHAKDLLRMPPEARSDPVPLELIRRMPVVRPDIAGRELLLLMRRSRVHIVLVRSEASQTLGIVTLEDVLESLVGDIYDETDKNSAEVAADAG